MNNGRYSYCAVSTRVRLARNLADYPFGPQNACNAPIVDLVTRTLRPLGDFNLIRISELEGAQAGYLKEKYIVSPLLVKNAATGAVVVSDDERVSVMINEEDHLRLQCVLEGLCPEEAYDNLFYLDRKLSERMSFATDSDFGYITACMTNLGTGMRASVMLFLPALTECGRMTELIAEMKGLGLTVRGAFGEGSRPEGCLYQVSNEVTLGYSEKEILTMVSFAARKLCDMELMQRNELISAYPLQEEDACRRAYGILTNCKILTYSEFAELFTKIGLGAYYGFFDIDMITLNKLFINMRPAILTYAEGVDDEMKRDELRAEIVREYLLR
ncbi:MAG: ATP--guanido phosphotransferase [Clostridia bacterium]|nr:ATP--guanido phosphotransferase [Clostridia bacterium]